MNRNKQSLTIRILHQKGLTVKEIANEMSISQHKVLSVLEHTGLKPRYKRNTPEPHAFASSCGKRVKI